MESVVETLKKLKISSISKILFYTVTKIMQFYTVTENGGIEKVFSEKQRNMVGQIN